MTPKRGLPARPVEAAVGRKLGEEEDKDTRKRTKSGNPIPELTRPKVTLHVDRDLLDQARDAAYWLSGPPESLTLTDLVNNAIEREIQRLTKRHNDGQPFKPRPAPIKRGRRA